MKRLTIAAAVLAIALGGGRMAAQQQLTVQADKPGAKIQPTMYGIFFEDINYGADGGLYADMVENRSFEFPQRLMGWETFGNVSVDDVKPAFSRNPHYVTLSNAGHDQKFTGMQNHGFFGMGLKQGMKYNFSVYGRINALQGDDASFRVILVGHDNAILTEDTVTVTDNKWQKYTCSLTSPVTDARAFLRIVLLNSSSAVDLDHVSLFPDDAWHGLRADLVQDLQDLHPGVFRFPGGCIVEGADLETRYQWKNSVGPVENRPLNENRWNYSTPARLSPSYYQSYGLGFYEYFLLSEKIGAEPLPVLSVGLACQFENRDDARNAHVALDDLQPYIDDALDLIEFANGSTDTKWGSLRAEMGHPQPFGLKQIAIGNEQWGELYPPRLAKFVEQIRAKYPDIQIVGSAGPMNGGPNFDYGWAEMRKLNVDLVDEHYYQTPDWFLNNARRYDNYDRKGPKVFAGEYAAHTSGPWQGGSNNWQSALSEAAFMTGLERNADVVLQSTYAPLFAHVDGWQWRPDLIWFDNLTSVRTANYYVQQLYSLYKGTDVLPLTKDGQTVAGEDGLYATACYDTDTKSYYVKVANASDKEQQLSITFRGLKSLGECKATTMAAGLTAANSIDDKTAVVPVESTVAVSGNVLNTSIAANAFVVYRLK